MARLLVLAVGAALAGALGTTPTVPTAHAASVSTIGHSVQGRPIRLIRTGTPSGPRILVIGCIHGNECAARRLVNPLLRRPMAADLWIVPTLNPDGFAHRTRQNARGVDLNRNWSDRWQLSGTRWSTYYSGPRPFSERESRVGRWLIRTLRPDVTIWYHQHMNLVWASGTSARAGRVYARQFGVRLRTDDSLRGTATGWQRRTFPSSSAIVVELPAGSMTSSARRRHIRAIEAVTRWAQLT